MLAGGVQWEGMGDKEGVKRLCLVRGLRNDSGLNNCFLNVVIQCLWHLHSFREALLSLQPQARPHSFTTPALPSFPEKVQLCVLCTTIQTKAALVQLTKGMGTPF